MHLIGPISEEAHVDGALSDQVIAEGVLVVHADPEQVVAGGELEILVPNWFFSSILSCLRTVAR